MTLPRFDASFCGWRAAAHHYVEWLSELDQTTLFAARFDQGTGRYLRSCLANRASLLDLKMAATASGILAGNQDDWTCCLKLPTASRTSFL